MSRGRPRTEPGQSGEIRVIKDNGGKWRTDGRVRTHTGEMKRIRTTAKTRKAALEKFQQKQDRILTTGSFDALTPDSTVKGLADYWIKHHDAKRSTLSTYRKALRLHILPAMGELRVYEVDTPMLQSFIDQLSTGTAQTSRAVLSSMFSNAVRWGIVAQSPIMHVQLAKRKKKPRKELTDAEIQDFKDRLKRWQEGATTAPRGLGLPELVDFLLGSGLRIGEALALNWSDIDLEQGLVTVRSTIDQTTRKRSDLPKTQSSRRTIPVTESALQALRIQHDRYGEKTPIVFPSRSLTYMSVQNVNGRFRDFKGDSPITPHTFRAHVGTRIERTFGVMAAARYLGHESTQVTEQYYLARPSVVEDYTSALEG